MRGRDARRGRCFGYARLCLGLEKLGARVGVSAEVEMTRATKARTYGPASLRTARRRRWSFMSPERLEGLRTDLELAEIPVQPGTILAAAKTTTFMAAITAGALIPALYLLSREGLALGAMLAALLAPVFVIELMLSYPSREASKAADEVLRTSSETTNLMIMSLRHEPSISRAIAFASGGHGRFARELRRCAWGVIMGTYASFEEALIELGRRWSKFSEDLKASLNAMVTASREFTEDGKRRALDRANDAMISGARRRIEEYALSLSMPSMLIFGLGILLPLMVGSFMPMLSWNLWSADEVSAGPGTGGGATSLQIVFVMNVLFPSVAALVAMNAVAGHPLDRRMTRATERERHLLPGVAVVTTASLAGILLAAALLSGQALSIGMLFSLVAPAAAWMIVRGRRSAQQRRTDEAALEDALFKTGSRMLEGDNFESSLHRAFEGSPGKGGQLLQRVSFRSAALGLEEALPDDVVSDFGASNAYDGLRIARQAAAKDELAAGMLAMDLAAYLRDLRDLRTSLFDKLRPTISMMKTTALLLAPIVLGVTYAIYLSLASMMGNHGMVDAGRDFFLVLGVFLAEMDAIVVYFIGGIDGTRAPNSQTLTLGSYLLASECTYTLTAALASM